MPIVSFLSMSFLCVVGIARAADDEVYDLRGPAPKKGQIFRATSTFSMKKGKISLTVGAAAGENEPGLKIEGSMDMASSSEKEVEVLAVDGRNVSKIRSKIIKDETVREITIMGNTKTEPVKKELQGEIVYSEFDKTKNKWKHVLEDTQPSEEQRKELKNFDDPENDDELYPAQKIKVGHAWKIDPAAFKKILGSKFTEAKGKGNSKFLRVEKLGNEMCAVIETEIDIRGKLKEDDGDIYIEMIGKLMTYRSLDLCVDMKFSVEGTAKFLGKMDQVDVRFEGKITSEGKSEIKKR